VLICTFIFKYDFAIKPQISSNAFDDDDDDDDEYYWCSGTSNTPHFFLCGLLFSFFFVGISTIEINISTSSCTHLKPFQFVNNIKAIRNH